MLIYRDGVDRRQLQWMVEEVIMLKRESASPERFEVSITTKPEKKRLDTAKTEPKKQGTANLKHAKQAIKQQATVKCFLLFRSLKVPELKKILEPKEIVKITESLEEKQVSYSKEVGELTGSDEIKKVSKSRD